jgi:hypothetical protein
MSTAPAHYPTLRAGRDHLKQVLDAAAEGRPASVSRGHTRVAAVDARRLAQFLGGWCFSRGGDRCLARFPGDWCPVFLGSGR